MQYLFFSVTGGLIWATTVTTVGYLLGRFLNLDTSVFEKNILFIVIGFASFGILLGYMLKRFAVKNFQEEVKGNP